MKRAIEDAHVSADQVAYVNLHGTGTRANDAMECHAVHLVAPNAWVSSSKPFVGHCLGAAGAVEAALCCMSLQDRLNRFPAHVFDGQTDTSLPPLKIATSDANTCSVHGTDGCYLSNSFAFGGSNCALVLGAADKGAQ
jgi:3-oxoacyl-[acyl-carrier-protein] synthase I